MEARAIDYDSESYDTPCPNAQRQDAEAWWAWQCPPTVRCPVYVNHDDTPALFDPEPPTIRMVG